MTNKPIAAELSETSATETDAAVIAAAEEAQAEEAKAEGNRLFHENHFEQAFTAYTKAIDFGGEDDCFLPSIHIYYSNRSLCSIKLENFGLAILDAEKAIQLKPSFSKAYYRRGTALAALGRFTKAFKDFSASHKLNPTKDTAIRVQECQKEVRREKFARAIYRENVKPLSETLDLSIYSAGLDSYGGPRYRKEPEFLTELLQYIRVPGNVLHKRDAYLIVLDMIEELKKIGNVVRITVLPENEFTVCGDVHGQFYDLLNIFEINGLPSDTNPYLFNGDFVDRGSFSAECIFCLFVAKLIYPSSMHLSRGNHESRGMNNLYGFHGEIVHKYDNTLYELFCECFCWLPLAHLINQKVLVVHGGLFAKDGVQIADIEKVDRNREPPDSGIMTELLWSDPQEEKGRLPSKRGVGCAFGPDITQLFLKNNNLDYIIRSHEMKEQGYSEEHDKKLITVFSAPNYCDSMQNKGAFIRLRGDDLKPKYTTFSAMPHPPVRAMQFASPLLSLMMAG